MRAMAAGSAVVERERLEAANGVIIGAEDVLAAAHEESARCVGEGWRLIGNGS